MYYLPARNFHHRAPPQPLCTQMNWSLLPGNLIQSICELLPPRQQRDLRLVCVTWKAQIDGSTKSMVTNSVVPFPIPVYKLPTLFPNLTELDLSCHKWGFGRIMRPKDCAQLQHLSLLNNLRSLKLANWVSLTLEGMGCIVRLEKVESLNLTNCLSITDSYLKCFTTTTKSNNNHNNSLIRHLCLNGCDKVTDKGLQYLCSLERLEELRATHLPRVVGNGLVKLSSNLEYLDISYCENLSDESVRSVISQCGFISNLSYLDLSGCHNIQSDTLNSLSSFSQLSRLKLSWMPQLIEIESWNELTKLKALDVSFASRLVMHRALPVIARMTQLRNLRLDGCPLLQGGTLKAEIFKDLKNLRCLDLGRWFNLQFILDLTNVLENLEVLNLADGGGCVRSRNDYFKKVAKLKVLGLSGYGYLPMNVIHGLSTVVSSLEVLNLSGLGNLNDRMVQEISKLTSLTYLDLSQNGVHCKVTMYGARYLRSLSLLRSLKICGWSEMSSTGFLVLRHFKNLTRLDLSNCLKLTGKGLKAISSTESLKELNLVNCFQVTTTDLGVLRKCVVLETLYLSHHVKGDVESEIPRVGNIQFVSPTDYMFENESNDNQTTHFRSLMETLSKEELEDTSSISTTPRRL
eukprot:g4237.t1